VRIEIATLLGQNGKLDEKKMDRLAMVLSNLKNSGKQILLVSSGAIALGTAKIGFKPDLKNFTDMQAAAAAGQAELIRVYQNHFGTYNQIVAQVLLTNDIINIPGRMEHAKNTFDTLLSMNIIPVINENDVVSTSDIELDDNYPLALNVATIVEADMILIKYDDNGKFLIVHRGEQSSLLVNNENELLHELENSYNKQVLKEYKNKSFPSSMKEIIQ